MTELPWRTATRRTIVGVPAWSWATSRSRPDPFDTTVISGVDAEWAWGGARGDGVRVCVVDSGVEGGHPGVGEVERAVTVAESANGRLAVTDCPATDLAGHGTACASVVRAMAPCASISSVRVLTDGKTGSGAALLTGLSWAIDEGYDVINLSLATTQPKLVAALHDLADRAYFRRSLLVVSAHNRPIRSFPWTFSSVVSVASHDEPDPMTYYYNPSPPAEFLARGVRVPVAWPGGGTIQSTGNSFAAPHISGLAALILSKHPWLTPFQLKSVLYLAANNVDSASGADRSPGETDEPGH